MSARLVALVALALAPALLAGCTRAEQSALEHNRSLWAGQRPAKYQYTFNWGCFCSPDLTDPVKITVENNKVTAAVSVASGKAVARLSDYRTIDGLFDFLQDAIDRNADKISASYDLKWGYPASVAVDYMKNAIDEEMAFSARDLTTQ